MSARAPLPQLATFALFLLVSCGDGDPTATGPGLDFDVGDPLAGAVAFEQECATCHASGDGLDLAFFAFTDTTIIRRAVAHVDTATAVDIVSHVNSILVEPEDRDMRLFQPRGAVLASDLEFASRLFGEDIWPAELTTERLLAIDPLQVPVAVPLPLWSVEEGNTDWMPDDPLPDGILDDQGSLPRAIIAGYRAAPTEENLVVATSILRVAAARRQNPEAPCLTNDLALADYETCFNVQRWISTFTAQHMVRYGIKEEIHPAVHDVWWDVGQTVRRALVKAHIDFENGLQNWASWMYLGWIFEPGRHASTYTARGLSNLRLPRHATWVALRSQVARPRRSFAAYADLTTAAQHAPRHWTFNVMRFAYRHILERLESGDVVRAHNREEARSRIERSFVISARKLSDAEAVELRALALQVLARFDDTGVKD